LKEIFNITQQRQHSIEYKVCVSLFEIYNEQINDLLKLDAESKSYLHYLVCNKVTQSRERKRERERERKGGVDLLLYHYCLSLTMILSHSLKVNSDGTISNITQCEVKTVEEVWRIIENGKLSLFNFFVKLGV
jgi:hypothetical protein